MTTATEKAHVGLQLIKEAVAEYVENSPDGVTNVEVARALDLESDFEGDQQNYLSWAVLGLLVNEGRIRYEKMTTGRVYYPVR
ncbi:MAG: hypothetical protein ACOC8X_09360 [Chloroflexota bacterium]